MSRINHVGQRFGRLVILESAPSFTQRGGNKRSAFKARCDCGNELVVHGARLRNGDTRSCGCLLKDTLSTRQKTHGMTGSPTFRVWCGMRKRCYYPRDLSYPRYGGRGIKICERWQDFANFLADMGPRPDGMTIERKNNGGDYEPGNCYWATTAEQNRNKRSNINVTIGGETLCLIDWAQRLGIDYAPVLNRITKLKWDAVRALTTPIRPQRNNVYKGDAT